MSKFVMRFTFWAFCLNIFGASVLAQFNTPSVDGTITANEYGVHVSGQNQQNTDTTQTWFVTWDDANLYVAVTNANLAEAAVIYIDKNPISPSNGGANADGTLAALNYDNTNIANLPFRADFRTYFKDGYRDFHNADGSNGWASGGSGYGSYASGAGNVRELAIPWSNITGGAGRPASFSFLGYLSSPGGYIYGQVPQGNPGGNLAPGTDYVRYFSVPNTNDGTSTKPFSLDTQVNSSNINFLGLKHDTFDSYYRSPFGAVTTGSNVTLRFRTDLQDASGVFVKIYAFDPATGQTAAPTEYPMTFFENRTEGSIVYDVYSVNLPTPSQAAILYYKFRVADGSASAFYSDAYTDDHDNLGQGGDGAASQSEPFPAFQITVYPANFQTPAWLQNAAVYHIFPERFRNGDHSNDWCRPGSTTGCPSLYGNSPSDNLVPSAWNTEICDPRSQTAGCQGKYGNQFYGGDLKGIENKLDYIKSLGFDAIYLNPIFKARSNSGYDTDDYLAVAEQFGGDAAFESLKNAANRRGMRIILDGVFNHMSQDSEYFDYYHRVAGNNGACESLSSPYRTWFNFLNNNVPCVYDPQNGRTDYEGWFGFGGLPVFNDNLPAVRDFFYRTPNSNVTQYWYNRGASGWRFDVATDLPHDWWHEYRGFAKSYKADAPLIGEIFPDASQWLAGDQLDSSMNYRFRKNVLGFARGADWEDNDNNGGNKILSLNPSQFNRSMLSIREDYPLPAQLSMLNLLDSHDTNRALFSLELPGDNGLTEAKQRLKLAATFQFTYLGAPMVYYGDEAGLDAPSRATNGAGLTEDDPYNRAPYPWADENGNNNVYGPADNDLINYYALLGALRKTHSSLRTGTFDAFLTGDSTVSTTDNNTFAFGRRNGADKVVVALNNGATANTATISVGTYFPNGTILRNAFDDSPVTVNNGVISLTLPARSGAIYVAQTQTGTATTIIGRVVTAEGIGVHRVFVGAVNLSNIGQSRYAQTNDDGFYRIENVPVGRYAVTPLDLRFRFEPGYRIVQARTAVAAANFTAIKR